LTTSENNAGEVLSHVLNRCSLQVADHVAAVVLLGMPNVRAMDFLGQPSTIESATIQLSRAGRHRYRRHARAELPRSQASIWRACQLTAKWLREWLRPDLIPAVRSVSAVLVENALTHTAGAAALRLETDGCAVIVAVEDTSTVPAARHEPTNNAHRISGLDVVSEVCQQWGNAPTPSGKTVWALISPPDLSG
jgi:hypothetical protein